MAFMNWLPLLRHRFLVYCMWLCIAFSRAYGQGFNVDTDLPTDPELGGGAPSSAFGAAANQPGFWNAILTGHPGPYGLRNLDGSLSAVTVSTVGWAGGGAWNNSANTGDFALLLNDSEEIGVGFQYTIS